MSSSAESRPIDASKRTSRKPVDSSLDSSLDSSGNADSSLSSRNGGSTEFTASVETLPSHHSSTHYSSTHLSSRISHQRISHQRISHQRISHRVVPRSRPRSWRGSVRASRIATNWWHCTPSRLALQHRQATEVPPLDPRLLAHLQSKGIWPLYSHQAQAIECGAGWTEHRRRFLDGEWQDAV